MKRITMLALILFTCLSAQAQYYPWNLLGIGVSRDKPITDEYNQKATRAYKEEEARDYARWQERTNRRIAALIKKKGMDPAHFQIVYESSYYAVSDTLICSYYQGRSESRYRLNGALYVEPRIPESLDCQKR